MNLNQEVLISNAEDMQTKYNGQKGWVFKLSKAHPEFVTVLTMDGNTVIFHESQLSEWDHNDHTKEMSNLSLGDCH
jgi:hypothetical protein